MEENSDNENKQLSKKMQSEMIEKPLDPRAVESMWNCCRYLLMLQVSSNYLNNIVFTGNRRQNHEDKFRGLLQSMCVV